MTPGHEVDGQVQQTRWREWQAAYACASRRNARYVTIVAVVAFACAVAFLLMQLIASPRAA